MMKNSIRLHLLTRVIRLNLLQGSQHKKSHSSQMHLIKSIKNAGALQRDLESITG
jgi:hypothetical protein